MRIICISFAITQVVLVVRPIDTVHVIFGQQVSTLYYLGATVARNIEIFLFL